MIIVEGMDNAGKTTLIANLCKEFPELKVLKSPGPTQGFGDRLAFIAGAIRNEDPRTIYDRFECISERVYGPVVRNGDVYGTYSWDLLSLTLRREPLIIYCRPPDSVIARWGDREQMEGVKTHKETLIQRYDWFFEIIEEIYLKTGLICRYDWTSNASFNHARAAVQLYLQTHKMVLPIRHHNVKTTEKIG
jgi:GTPase SAR1 family protein